MLVYAIRHGLTELNKKGIVNGHIDEPLLPEGIKAAEQIALRVPKGIQHIYASSLLRTRQTAAIINERVQVSITFHDELKEIDLGRLAGRDWMLMQLGAELTRVHRAVRYNYRNFGGESVEDVKKRVIQFLQGILGLHADREAFIVTHGGIIRLIHYLQFGEALQHIPNLSLHEFDIKKILDYPLQFPR